MTTVRITYFGMEGEGPTLTKAKLDAGAKIEKALSGYWTPRLFRVKNLVAVIYREPTGYHYLALQDGNEVQRMPSSHGPHEKQKDAEQAALSHLCQNAWDGEQGEAFDALTVDLAPERKRELFRWSEWQLRWRHAVAHGLTRDEAWAWASERYNHAEAMAETPQKPAPKTAAVA